MLGAKGLVNRRQAGLSQQANLSMGLLLPQPLLGGLPGRLHHARATCARMNFPHSVEVHKGHLLTVGPTVGTPRMMRMNATSCNRQVRVGPMAHRLPTATATRPLMDLAWMSAGPWSGSISHGRRVMTGLLCGGRITQSWTGRAGIQWGMGPLGRAIQMLKDMLHCMATRSPPDQMRSLEIMGTLISVGHIPHPHPPLMCARVATGPPAQRTTPTATLTILGIPDHGRIIQIAGC